MNVLTEYPFSQARQELTAVIDQVQRCSPVMIRARKRSEEPAVIMSKSLITGLLNLPTEPLTVTPRFASEDDGSVTLVLNPLEIVCNGSTRADAIKGAIRDAIEYASEYLAPENVQLYLRSPNRRNHLPLVLRIGLCETDAEVMSVLNLA
jgi:hypothetical protein